MCFGRFFGVNRFFGVGFGELEIPGGLVGFGVGLGVGLTVGRGVGFTVGVGAIPTVGRGVGDGIGRGNPPTPGGGPGGGPITFPPYLGVGACLPGPTTDGGFGTGRFGFCFRISATIRSRLGSGGKFLINRCVRMIRRKSARRGAGSFFIPALTWRNSPARTSVH